MNNIINTNKQHYAELFTKYISKNYSDKIDKIIVYGSSIDSSIKNPDKIDFAIRLTNDPNNIDYELLGDLMDYMGDIVDEGDFTITFICNNTSKSYKESIKKGVCIYG